MVESRSIVNGPSPGPTPAAQARDTSSRLTRFNWRTCPHRDIEKFPDEVQDFATSLFRCNRNGIVPTTVLLAGSTGTGCCGKIAEAGTSWVAFPGSLSRAITEGQAGICSSCPHTGESGLREYLTSVRLR